MTRSFAGYEGGAIAGRLLGYLHDFVARNGLGVVVAAETGFRIGRDPDTVRAPDVGFICAARAARRTRGYFPGPPDLAVEIACPTTVPARCWRRSATGYPPPARRSGWLTRPRKRCYLADPVRTASICGQGGRRRGCRLPPGDGRLIESRRLGRAHRSGRCVDRGVGAEVIEMIGDRARGYPGVRQKQGGSSEGKPHQANVRTLRAPFCARPTLLTPRLSSRHCGVKRAWHRR